MPEGGLEEPQTNMQPLEGTKALYNAGSLLEEIFYVYREKIFDQPIAKVEIKEDKVYMHDGRYSTGLSRYDFVQPFPNHLLSNESDKKAVLVYMACSDAVGWMQEVVEYVLASKIIPEIPSWSS